MAIQVNGTSVITNGRGLVNVTAIDASTKGAIEAAGVGGGATAAPNWNPAATPDTTLTGNGTYSISGVADNVWVVFYMVGGGCGGHRSYGSILSMAGAAYVWTSLSQDVPSSISYSVGAGGAGNSNHSINPGADTTMTASGITVRAKGGVEASNVRNEGANVLLSDFPSLSSPFNTAAIPTKGLGTDFDISGGSGANPSTNGSGSSGSVLGAGGGATGFFTSTPGGTSTYAGNGGQGSRTGTTTAGTVPGGAGGSSYAGSGQIGKNGAAGNIRIYILD